MRMTLRNASRYNPNFVLKICQKWAKLKNPDTNWIIKDGLRKLKQTHKSQVEKLVSSLK